MEEKKVNKAEEVKEEVKVEEDSEKLTDEEMSSVAAGGTIHFILKTESPE